PAAVSFTTAALAAVVGCSATSAPVARPSHPLPAPSASPPAASPSASPAGLPTYGGASVAWPHLARVTPAPPPLGAVLTRDHVRLGGGGTLAPGLTLPRIGGTAARPLVLSPCERQVTVVGGSFGRLPASGAPDTLVVLDAGHGG